MQKIFSIDVFGKQIFESCAEQWLKLCKEQKREWILSNTTQTDEILITEFINNPKISKECKCLDCGKNKKYVNISNRISKEATTITESTDNTEHNGKDSIERPKKPKGRKGK